MVTKILDKKVKSKYISHFAWEKTAMFSFDMFSQSHLQQAESHVQRLDDVGLARQRVAAARGLPPRHLGFDALKSMQHLIL